MLDPNRFDGLTFDCYGTLIDWESGMARALRPLALRADRPPAEIIAAFGEIEREVEAGPYAPYREVCAEVTRRIAARFGIDLEPAEERTLAESIRHWPAHADTVEALTRLKTRYRLAILSNIDRDLFEGTRPHLGVELDAAVTAEDVGAYKPDHAHFLRGLEVLDLPRERVLHVAESRFHDVEPANALGIAVVHVDRSGAGGRGGATASGAGGGTPDLVVASMAELADLLTPAT